MLLITIGVMLLGAGVATAAAPGSRLVHLVFSSDRVTLTLPAVGCPVKHPGCTWMLFVNEPASGAVVGTATGTTGTLSVAYPSNYCGIVQADVLVGPPPWHKRVGHRRTIQTATTCSASSLPFNGGSPVQTITAGTPAKGSSADPAHLPFTGLDVAPLTIFGSSLIALGLLMATDVWAAKWVRRRLASTSATVSRWLLGE